MCGNFKCGNCKKRLARLQDVLQRTKDSLTKCYDADTLHSISRGSDMERFFAQCEINKYNNASPLLNEIIRICNEFDEIYFFKGAYQFYGETYGKKLDDLQTILNNIKKDLTQCYDIDTFIMLRERCNMQMLWAKSQLQIYDEHSVALQNNTKIENNVLLLNQIIRICNEFDQIHFFEGAEKFYS